MQNTIFRVITPSNWIRFINSDFINKLWISNSFAPMTIKSLLKFIANQNQSKSIVHNVLHIVHRWFQAAKRNICIAVQEKIPSNADDTKFRSIITNLLVKSARAIILFTRADDARSVKYLDENINVGDFYNRMLTFICFQRNYRIPEIHLDHYYWFVPYLVCCVPDQIGNYWWEDGLAVL